MAGFLMIVVLMGTSGCGLVNTALSAGIAYGLYRLTSD